MRIADCGLERNGEFVHAFKNRLERLAFTFGKGVGGVAIRAAEIAGGEPDKDARQTGKSALTLDTDVDFVDSQGHAHRKRR
jgi:hypothetical protein